MSLADEVTTRLGTTKLVQLTRPDGKAETTVDTDVLNAAVADVEAEFALVGVALDDTDALHIVVGVAGVTWKLYEYKGQGDSTRSLETKFREALDRLRKVTARDRIAPTSDSQLSPSRDKPPGFTGTVRPSFDRERLSGFSPQAPGARSTLPRDWP